MLIKSRLTKYDNLDNQYYQTKNIAICFSKNTIWIDDLPGNHHNRAAIIHQNTRHSFATHEFQNLIKGILVSFLEIGSYWLFYVKYENRIVRELSTTGLWKKLMRGISTGFVLQCLTISVIYLYGGFKVISINPFSALIIPFTIAFTVAIIEEVLLRGIVFRITEEKWGSIIALIISGLIFGGVHLVNQHVTVVSTLCIIVVGVLLGAAYMYYQNLWVSIAIHFAWNFTQNGIFGAITSGNEKTSSLLTTQLTGPEILTGGRFGPEGSIQALLFCLIAAIVIMRLLYQQNKILKPSGINGPGID